VEALSDLATEFRERLLPLQLDVTDRAADFAAVRHAQQHFGRLDVVVNNAGYGSSGPSRSCPKLRPGRRSKPTSSARSG